MKSLRASAALLGLLLLVGDIAPALADVDVVIGYETRCNGEIDECG